jgi:hypothetical protein
MSLFDFFRRLFRRTPPPQPIPRAPLIQPEDRLIETMVFCGERKPTCGDLKAQYPDIPDAEIIEMWNGLHDEARTAVRAVLRVCGISKAGDINTLGCTGAVKHGLSRDAASALILDLAGSGVGLPCFVPPSRYCLVHKTIGGLQEGQKPYFTEVVNDISRELNATERGTVKLMEASRRIRGERLDGRLADTVDALSGYELPPGFEREEEEDEADGTFDSVIGRKGD